MLVHRRVTPSAICRRYPFIHLGEERQSGVKFLVYMEAKRRARLEPRTSRSRVRGVNRSVTHAALRVIRIKFLLVISILCKTEWSWELRTWSHKINYLDILSTSSHYFQGHPTDLSLKTNFSQQSPKMPKLASEFFIALRYFFKISSCTSVGSVSQIMCYTTSSM